MTCHTIAGPRGIIGTVCTANAFVNLERFGVKVWCEYHSYLGPSFYRSERAITEIHTPSRKTWDAYEVWRKEIEG